jgi:hypothetical protein
VNVDALGKSYHGLAANKTSGGIEVCDRVSDRSGCSATGFAAIRGQSLGQTLECQSATGTLLQHAELVSEPTSGMEVVDIVAASTLIGPSS